MTAVSLRRVITLFEGDWERYTVMEITDGLVRRAARLAERHALRGYDAVHLAAATDLRSARGRLRFGCFHDRLSSAARRERLTILS